ncbi:MAG: electron transfer flavoprotein subunit beta/FixA family protein [Planctomycetota bacterium]|nr:electron transfer flavoprotein subunit beta/FixA family protein [Planctomycetota bacterium]
MNIAVCIKRVPVTTLEPKIAADGKSLDSSGVEYMISFYDELAVEEAVRIKEQHGGEVTVLTIGPSEASKHVRECLAKGADRGVILVDPVWGARDCHATARVLADKLSELGAELVFTGRVATDRDNGAVGPMIAAMLGWPCVTDAVEVELAQGKLSVKREAEGGVEVYTCSLPAVITCQKDLNEPRYAGLKGIMAAKKKPIEEIPCPDVPNQAEVVGLELPPARTEGRIVGEGVDAVPALVDALRNEAKVL